MEDASEKSEVNKYDVNVTVKYQTHKAGSWILVILAFVMGIALVVLLKQEGFYKFELIVFSVLFVLTIFVLTAIQMCYVLTAKSIAQSAIQLKIEEEKRKEEEIKKDIEEKKYECASKIHKVQIV